MLEPNQELRPNIWQVCEIAFKLQSKENPVTNIQVGLKSSTHQFFIDYYTTIVRAIGILEFSP